MEYLLHVCRKVSVAVISSFSNAITSEEDRTGRYLNCCRKDTLSKPRCLHCASKAEEGGCDGCGQEGEGGFSNDLFRRWSSLLGNSQISNWWFVTEYQLKHSIFIGIIKNVIVYSNGNQAFLYYVRCKLQTHSPSTTQLEFTAPM